MYTIVAKGTVPPCLPLLHHEAQVYRHLAALQGAGMPVCLAAIDLVRPYYHARLEIVHRLLIARGCVSLADQRVKDDTEKAMVESAIRKIQEMGVVHKDLCLENMLWCEGNKGVMVIDFEQSVIPPLLTNAEGGKRRKPPLGDMVNHGKHFKRGNMDLELNSIAGWENL